MRGRAWLFVGAAGLALALLGQLDGLGPVAAAAVTVASSVGLALIAHGGVPLASEAIAFGASGALAYEASRPIFPLLASGLLLAFVFGTRAMRSRTWRELCFHVGVAFFAGVSASWVARANEGMDMTLWLVALGVAALLASIPWLLPAGAARGFALRRLAGRARGAMRVRLLRAVCAHDELRELELPRAVERRLDRAFDDVTKQAERLLERTTGSDVRLVEAVDQLTRVARAARTREALLEQLDRGSLDGETEALEAEVAALLEL